MGDGVDGVHSPSALRLVVEESGREQGDAIIRHPNMEERLVLGPPFNNKTVTLKPAVST